MGDDLQRVRCNYMFFTNVFVSDKWLKTSFLVVDELSDPTVKTKYFLFTMTLLCNVILPLQCDAQELTKYNT